jgi:hypothetical protein
VVHNYAFNWDMFAEAIVDNQGVCIQGRYINHLYFICTDAIYVHLYSFNC